MNEVKTLSINKMNKNYSFKLLLVLMGLSIQNYIFAQSPKHISIELCYTMARQNYPLIKQKDLIAKANSYTIENINKGYLPQLNISGQATYQSEVPHLPDIKIPNFPLKTLIPVADKDQYKIYGEIYQPITDMLTVRDQKKYQEDLNAIRDGNLETELYKLKDRVNQLYFGALLAEQQDLQNSLLIKDIQTGMDKVKVAIENGSELKSSLNKLLAEKLKAEQHSIELKSAKTAYLSMLGLFINQKLDDNIQLDLPKNILPSPDINRPELKVFSLQMETYKIQMELINVKNLPRFGVFFQDGYGKPNPLNPYTITWANYYVTGIRLNWALSGLYTMKKEKQILALESKILDAQQETFLFNTHLSMQQQNEDINKFESLLKSDDEIISLRESIKNTSANQLSNGIITANDYLIEINAEDQARQSKVLHEIQLLFTQYNYQNTTGN